MSSRILIRAWVCACGLACLLAGTLAWAQQGVVDLDGRAANPLKANSGKITVLVFLRRDCPVSGRYAPVIQQISRQYQGKADFWLVYPGKHESAEEIRKSVTQFGYRLPVVRDPEFSLAHVSQVQITPEVAVFDREHHLIYDGRIDDQYIDVNRARPTPTTHELRDALDAVLAGRPVAHTDVRGVGCYISDLE